MSCADCPKETNASDTHYIIHTGGDYNSFLLPLQKIAPTYTDFIPQYGHVTIENNCIKYTGGQEPPTQEGFEVVKPGMFRSIWPSCVSRVLCVQVLDSGLLKIDGHCFNHLLRLGLINLSLSTCQQCKNRKQI